MSNRVLRLSNLAINWWSCNQQSRSSDNKKIIKRKKKEQHAESKLKHNTKQNKRRRRSKICSSRELAPFLPLLVLNGLPPSTIADISPRTPSTSSHLASRLPLAEAGASEAALRKNNFLGNWFGRWRSSSPTPVTGACLLSSSPPYSSIEVGLGIARRRTSWQSLCVSW